MGKVKKSSGRIMFFFFLQYPCIFCNILILTRTVQGDIICGWDGRIGNNIALKVDKLRFVESPSPLGKA